jgi:redox-sensitive bicupin YhaK (pirin superfamily)
MKRVGESQTRENSKHSRRSSSDAEWTWRSRATSQLLILAGAAIDEPMVAEGPFT